MTGSVEDYAADLIAGLEVVNLIFIQRVESEFSQRGQQSGWKCFICCAKCLLAIGPIMRCDRNNVNYFPKAFTHSSFNWLAITVQFKRVPLQIKSMLPAINPNDISHCKSPLSRMSSSVTRPIAVDSLTHSD